jgi:hypothetical protein
VRTKIRRSEFPRLARAADARRAAARAAARAEEEKNQRLVSAFYRRLISEETDGRQDRRRSAAVAERHAADIAHRRAVAREVRDQHCRTAARDAMTALLLAAPQW